MKLIFVLFFRSPARAAIPVVYLAVSLDLENKPFDYLFLMSRKEADEKALNPENGKRLWEMSEQLVECYLTTSAELACRQAWIH